MDAYVDISEECTRQMQSSMRTVHNVHDSVFLIMCCSEPSLKVCSTMPMRNQRLQACSLYNCSKLEKDKTCDIKCYNGERKVLNFISRQTVHP